MNHSLPKRICIDARFYRKATAGVGRYTRGFIHALQKIDKVNDYTVILTPTDYAEWPKETTPPNWQVKVMDIVHYSFAEQTQLLTYLNQEKFDLVYFTMFNHPLFYRGKRMVMIHDLIMHFYPPRPLWHPRTWAYRYMMHHAAHWSEKIINNSENTKRDVIKFLHVPEEKCVVALLAVEPEFKPQHNEKHFAELREKYGLTKPFIFFVNAWRPHKGLPELVKAFLSIKKDHDVQLLVAGQPNKSFPDVETSVRNAQKETRDIITPGFISDEDMVTLYSMAELYVNPTHYEGFGLGILEAMSCGCPVVTADNSCLPEVAGDAACYFKTKDTDDLARAIRDMLDDPQLRKDLRQKGFEQAKKFSYEKTAEETRAVFEEILALN